MKLVPVLSPKEAEALVRFLSLDLDAIGVPEEDAKHLHAVRRKITGEKKEKHAPGPPKRIEISKPPFL